MHVNTYSFWFGASCLFFRSVSKYRIRGIHGNNDHMNTEFLCIQVTIESDNLFPRPNYIDFRKSGSGLAWLCGLCTASKISCNYISGLSGARIMAHEIGHK